MGFLSELKKLFFVKKSVAKSAADKGMNYAKDKTSDLIDATEEGLSGAGESIMEKTSGLRDAVLDKAGDVVETTGEVLGKVSDKVEDVVEKSWDSIKETKDKVVESEAVQSAADFTENVGDKVLDTGEKLMDSAKDVSETMGEKVLEAKDKLVEKAKEVTENLSEKLDETIEKAEKMAEAEENQPKKDFVDDTLDASGSLLEGKDDFFAKASKYADGDYGSFSEGKITITDAPTPSDDEIVEPVKAAGFVDADGDGDEIIDDATIVNEEE